jgi:ribosomal-protein-alanine N-acetyltransferase
MHSFTTERLLIRPLSEQDRHFFCQQFTNEKVMRHNGGILNNEQASKAFQRSLNANERARKGGKKSLLTWAIVCLKKEVIIGTQTLSFLIRPHNKKIMQQAEKKGLKQTEIGIMLAPKSNGKLYPEEAMGALMEYTFSQLKYNRVNAFYDSKNLATKRFVDKLGFTPAKEFASESNYQNENTNKTSYHYYDHQHWQQKIITKVFPRSI